MLHTLTVRTARAARAALGVATFAVALASFGGSASAQESPELAVNALAPEITAEAELAVSAFDEFAATDDLADYLEYAAHRTSTARLAADQLGYNEFDMIQAWKSTSLEHQRAVLAAMTQVGVPYQTNASVEDEGFDCSGLTLYAFAEAGIDIVRISGDQINASRKVDADEAEAGFLAHYPGHIMMYLGVDDAVVHSVNTGRTVEIDTISTKRFDNVTFGDPLT